MKVVVTGGAGFIGSNLCRRLAEATDDYEVVVVDDFSTGRPENLSGLNVKLIQGSITNAALLDDACTKAHAVVHLAARGSVPRSVADPVGTHTANATGTLSVLEAARANGVSHVIVAGSSSVYGAADVEQRSEAMSVQPASPYAASKVATEAYALAYQQAFGIPVLVLRFFNVFGPGQRYDVPYPAVIPTFVARALQGEPLTIQGDGLQTRDFTYVGSVVETIRQALVSRIAHDTPVNLGFGAAINLQELVATLSEAVGHPLTANNESPRPGDVRQSRASTHLMRRLFPNVGSPPSLVEGLKMTVDWARQQPEFVS